MSDDRKLFDYSGTLSDQGDRKSWRPEATSAHRRVDGWEAYKNWLSRVKEEKGPRSRVDRSLYTWKGYKDWTEKVKQNWDNEEQ